MEESAAAKAQVSTEERILQPEPGASKKSGSKTSSTGSDAGYDFLEGSGFVLEGLEEKGLDAKSYIQVR